MSYSYYRSRGRRLIVFAVIDFALAAMNLIVGFVSQTNGGVVWPLNYLVGVGILALGIYNIRAGLDALREADRQGR